MVGDANMIYLWNEPKKTLNRDIGEYDRACSPDRFLLRQGRPLNKEEFSLVAKVEFEIPKTRVLQFDCLPNNSSIPLINGRIKDILNAVAPGEVQFFPAKLICKDGELNGYYFLNATHTFKGIDHEKTHFVRLGNTELIIDFNYLTYKKGCMGSLNVARDEEYLGNLLVSNKIKAIFYQERITGVWLVRPEDYFKPISQLL
jgi:hypothetical protein